MKHSEYIRFTPVDISLTHTTSRELLGTQEQDFDIMICPGVSTYVGGDITAGMYALDFDKREKPCVLVDLGTNGEMAIGCKDPYHGDFHSGRTGI